MNRRTFLFGTGTAAVGSSLMLGTGAFTTTQADRQLAVEVVPDESMLVGLSPGELNPQYVSPTQETAAPTYMINITTDNGELGLDGGEYALGANTTTRIEGLLTVANNSQSAVRVSAEFVPGSDWFPGSQWVPGSEWIFAGTGGAEETTSLLENEFLLDTGESLQVGLELELLDVEEGQYDGTLQLQAEDADEIE